MENQFYTEHISIPQPRPASKTLHNLTFLLLSLPLAMLYFVLTLCGLLTGLGTLIIWAGLPILFTTLLTIQALAEVERRIVSNLLFISLPPRVRLLPEQPRGLLRHLATQLNDPYTWTSILYMLLKLPISIFNFTLALVLPIICGACTFLPLVYLTDLFIARSTTANWDMTVIPGFITGSGGIFDTTMFLRTFLGIPIGIVGWFISRTIIGYVALLSGELARALLGPGVNSPAQPHTAHSIPPMPVATGEERFYTER